MAVTVAHPPVPGRNRCGTRRISPPGPARVGIACLDAGLRGLKATSETPQSGLEIIADMGVVSEAHILTVLQRRFGVKRSPSVRNIPARSPSVAIAGKARSHGRGSYQIGAHDPVAGGQDSAAAVAVLTAVA